MLNGIVKSSFIYYSVKRLVKSQSTQPKQIFSIILIVKIDYSFVQI
jgi:hypothetical protein